MLKNSLFWLFLAISGSKSLEEGFSTLSDRPERRKMDSVEFTNEDETCRTNFVRIFGEGEDDYVGTSGTFEKYFMFGGGVDSSGNMYFTGNSASEAVTGSDGKTQMLLMKMSSDGFLTWTKEFGHDN